MNIGNSFKNTSGKVDGKVHLFGNDATSFIFEPSVSKEGKQYHKIIADPYGDPREIGAAFERIKGNKAYYSAVFDVPSLPAPLNVAFFPDDEIAGKFNIVWNRSEPAAPKAEATAENGQAQARRFVGSNASMTP